MIVSLSKIPPPQATLGTKALFFINCVFLEYNLQIFKSILLYLQISKIDFTLQYIISFLHFLNKNQSSTLKIISDFDLNE